MVAAPIIITRTEPGASETAERLQNRGCAVCVSPMLVLKRSGAELPDLASYHHIVFTSANGVAFFIAAAGGAGRNLTAWCVGPSTADAARAAGFETVQEGVGDAEDLLALILTSIAASPGRFLHVANAAAKGRLMQGLAEAGLQADFVPLYEAEPQASVSPIAAAAMREGPVIILAHSEKGAEAFVMAVKGEDLSQHIAVGISERAVAPLRRAGCGQCYTATAPNEDALLDALRHLC